MKVKITLFFCIFLVLSTTICAQTIYISENFDGTSKPINWSYGYVSGTIDWQYQDGGYTSGDPGTGEPPYAYQGGGNAMFYYPSANNETTKLITPAFDLSNAIKPELVFWHAQADKKYAGSYNHDELRVYYKKTFTSDWVLLAAYVEEVINWTERRIQLPDSSLTNTYYLAFEGKTKNGFGTCIDSMFVIETGVTPKYIESIEVTQPITRVVPSSSLNNRILQVDISVLGNDGNLVMDSISFKSLNTNDTDIRTNGVKLYASSDNYYFNASQIGTSQNFVDGSVSFYGLDYSLPIGASSLWLTYDIIDDTNHELQNNVLDAYIPENGIKVNSNYYPSINKSPYGDRKIAESIFYDNFESGLNWDLSGEFDHGTPQAKGGPMGSPDPDNAASGENIIGTDLFADGNYANDLDYHSYEAKSPLIDAEFYKNTRLYYTRWLNIEVSDSALIEYSLNNGVDWGKIWLSNATINDYQWQYIELNTSNYTDKVTNLMLNFSLGGTNSSWTFSGWNIDDVFLTGDYIAKDVGITDWIAPLSGCGHTDQEYVTVEITNFAGDVLTDPLPLSYTFDNGVTLYRDTIQTTNIPVKGSITYKITKPIDLTTPGWYNNVYATTNLPGDEESTNNKFNTQIFITPTYTLPYSQNFETNYGYYLVGGTNSTWEYGAPTGTVINSAASGTKIWATNLSGNYLNNDSSFIESPCFDFTNKYNIIFEFKCVGLSQDKTDGLTLLYTIDGGTTWKVAPDNNDYYWNWYTETSISQLNNNPGIDTTDGVWKTFRQLLPSEVQNQDNVKFRFLFESNGSEQYEGFGIDDVKIYEAPADVGVSSINTPVSACELSPDTTIQVYVENYGIDTIHIGEKIPMVLDFNSKIIKDTLEVVSTFDPGTNQLFTFETPVNMGSAGEYKFKINTKFESNQYFYNETVSNDTLYDTLYVYGMPNYNPFNDQIGANPVTNITLDAGAGYADYEWTLPSGSDPGTQTWGVQNEGWHYVTVTNDSLCIATDSTDIIESEIDLILNEIYTTLEDSCSRDDSTVISVRFTNNNINSKDLAINDTILFGYIINDEPIVTDTLFIGSTVPVGSSVDFTFNQKANFKEPNQYTIKVFTNILKDLDHSNDTVPATFNTWGYPNVELEFDTIYSSQADTLTLDAGEGFAGYAWSSGQGTQTITPTNVSTQYIVTVTSAHCSTDSDTTYVETHDFGITAVNYPITQCEDDASTSDNLTVEVTNYSDNTYLATDSVVIFYNYDNSGWTRRSHLLTGGLASLGTIELTIDQINAKTTGNHTLKLYTSSVRDANNSNDTIEYSFETWANPYIELLYDTIYTMQADTVVLIPTLGYDSYSWNTGSTNDTLEVSNNISAKYVVTAEDEHGCGSYSDSTQIFTYNLKLNALTKPKDACTHTSSENVEISIKNLSNDVISSGSSILVGYILNNAPVEYDTINLASDLYPTGSITYTFNTPVDLSVVGKYTIKAFIDLDYDVFRENDTIYNAISTYGNPSVELGADIFTSSPDTVVITADEGYTSYFWNDNDGLSDNILNVSYPATKEYSVTVVNTNGCTANDKLTVYTYDVLANSLDSPINQCILSNTEIVKIGVTNNGEDILYAGEPVEVGYRLNSGVYVSEPFTLGKTLYPDSTEVFTMTASVDLSEFKDHEFKIFAKLTNVDVETNDTTTKTVMHLKPDFDLGDPQESNTDSYEIDAGVGYIDYAWFDGVTTTQKYTVDINNQQPNNYYTVTVTSANGCEASDSIEVTFTAKADLSVTQLIEPTAECWVDGKKQAVKVEVSNTGFINLIATTTFTLGYTIDDGTPVTETYELTSPFNASTSFEFEFNDSITFPSGKMYEFKPFVKFPNDGNESNDTLTSNNTVDMSAPEVDFGTDTVRFPDQYTIVLSDTYEDYLWSTGEKTATITVTTTGDYSVTVTNEYGCDASGTLYCLNTTTGLDDFIHGNGYSISYYPNPASNELKVDISNTEPKDLSIEIVNVQGQILQNKKYKNSLNAIESIDVSHYSKGVYYIRFKIDDKFYIRKLMIQ